MPQNRDTATINVKPADYPILTRVCSDPLLRVMCFCSDDVQGRQNVTFPYQSEIKVNTGEVKANLRGLKNKPGSTRPVDITKELRLNVVSYSNRVDLTYALTNKASGYSPSNVRYLGTLPPALVFHTFPDVRSPCSHVSILIAALEILLWSLCCEDHTYYRPCEET